MTRDELHYLADHVNDEMFDRIRDLREQVKVLSEEKIHTDRRINNQRKELKRKDQRIKELQEIIERDKQLLVATASFIKYNSLHDYTVTYDEAVCDGACLKEDCLIQIEIIEQTIKERKKEGESETR